jgi:polysaccharide biosynthesis protein PslH
VVVPLPLDAEYFAPRPEIPERPGRIVFTGLMNHPPNVDAALFFARDVLPRLRARLPDAHLQVVGREPTRAVLALGALPGVEVTGGVADVRPHLAEAQVVVVPLRFGAGARQKILEAWAMQRCVVATTLGAEGLGARDGHNLLLADGAAALCERVATALSDAALRDRVRRPGRALVRAAHDPAQVAAGLYDALRAARA